MLGLAAAAFGVAPAIYHARLDALWGDPHQARALRTMLREQLDGAGPPGDEEHPQPPVSFRILPRVLGNAHRVVAQGREVAETALRAVSDNPTFLFDDDAALDIVSTGGFHSGTAAPGDRRAHVHPRRFHADRPARAPSPADEPPRAAAL